MLLNLLLLVAVASVSLPLAVLVKTDFTVVSPFPEVLGAGLWVVVSAKTAVFHAMRVDRISWRSASILDLLRIACASLLASVAAFAAATLLTSLALAPSIWIIDCLLCFLAVGGVGFIARIYREAVRPASPGGADKTILIYGCGAAGETLAREIRSNPKLGMRVVGFLDDDPRKRGGSVLGLPVVGSGRDAARVVARYSRAGGCISEIIIAMPSASGREMRAAIANCRAAGVPFRTVPGLGELLEGRVLSRQLRDVSVNDLLGRAPVSIDEARVKASISGKAVMVTGGCGSIGSEVCRQVARFNARKLVIFDQAESEMFMLAMDIRRRFPYVEIVQEIGDIRRPDRVDEAVESNEVDVIFHAAAYKHVPLMETHVIEAVENNVLGTYNVARAAHRYGVRKFVLISTDKAVNPASVMGATKRAAEIIVSAMPLDGAPNVTTYVSVRFGNVLASAGSVVQIFQRQIAAGGPVTVTHPEMRRYFMSIPEAVQLVLEASTIGKGSEVFVLDMGEPVSIVELARNMIRLAGLQPDEDIEIRFTGARPGEKLFEELKLNDEDVLPTTNDKIRVFRTQAPRAFEVARWIDELRQIVAERRAHVAKAHLAALVPEYDTYAAAKLAGVSARRSAAAAQFSSGLERRAMHG